jgi:hypothetical protein
VSRTAVLAEAARIEPAAAVDVTAAPHRAGVPAFAHRAGQLLA